LLFVGKKKYISIDKCKTTRVKKFIYIYYEM